MGPEVLGSFFGCAEPSNLFWWTPKGTGPESLPQDTPPHPTISLLLPLHRASWQWQNQ